MALAHHHLKILSVGKNVRSTMDILDEALAIETQAMGGSLTATTSSHGSRLPSYAGLSRKQGNTKRHCSKETDQ